MTTKIAFLFAALLPGAALSAQSHLVHPAPYARVEGESSQEWPFGSARTWTSVTGVRYQQAHDALSARTVSIKGMAFRRDGKDSLPLRGWTVEMDLTLSTSPRPAYQILPEFASNMGKDAVTVVSRKKIHFPAFPAGWGFPKPFRADLPFDQGKSFLLRGGKTLCWETKVWWSDQWKNGESSLRFDATARMEKIQITSYGHGCYVSGSYEPASMDFYIDPKRPWDLQLWISGGSPGGLGFLLGSLGQANPPLRAGGLLCRFYLDPAAFFSLSPILHFDMQGRFSNRFFYLPIPKDPALRGSAFHAQCVLSDPQPRTFRLTNAVHVFIPYQWPDAPWRGIGFCMAKGARPDLLKTGIPASYKGLVVRFRI